MRRVFREDFVTFLPRRLSKSATASGRIPSRATKHVANSEIESSTIYARELTPHTNAEETCKVVTMLSH